MPIKKKEFTKKYAATMDNVTGDGVWSGRGIAIPVGGAMFGGDDYKQKIGRNKIPWNMSDFRGEPSMSADAGFSSIAMSRVATPEAVTKSKNPMFPNQDVKEISDDDIYLIEDEQSSIVEEVMRRNKYIFDENESIKNSRYSLVEANDLMMSEDVSWSDLKDYVPDAVGDIGDAVVDAVDDFDAGAVARAAIPDVIEDEVMQGYEHVVNFLGTIKDNYGDPAYDIMVDKLDQITGGDAEEVLQKAKEVAEEIGGDIVKLAAASIPTIGPVVAAGYVLYNLGELQVGEDQARRAVDKLITVGSESDVKELERVSTQMYDDYVDMLQAGSYLIPFIGLRSGIARIGANVLQKLGVKTAGSFLGVAGAGAFGSAIRSEIILNPIFRFLTSLRDVESLGQLDLDKTFLVENVIEATSVLGVLHFMRTRAEEQLEEWKASGSVGEFKFDPAGLEDERESALERLSLDDYRARFDDMVGDFSEKIDDAIERDTLDNLANEIIEEGKMSKEDLIREFIRESIYHNARSGNPPQPAGYVYREPLTSDEDSESYTGDSKNLVNYKTDMGGVSYQSAPEDIREAALRRIIRRKIQEQKKSS